MVADGEGGRAADPRVRTAGVAGGVAGDDADAEVVGLIVHRFPEFGELVVGHLGRERKGDGEMRGVQPGDGDVREDDVDGEPARALEAEGGEHGDGVGRDGDRGAVDIEETEVDAVGRAERHVVAGRAQPRVDVLVEELAVDLSEVGHTRPPGAASKNVLIRRRRGRDGLRFRSRFRSRRGSRSPGWSARSLAGRKVGRSPVPAHEETRRRFEGAWKVPPPDCSRVGST